MNIFDFFWEGYTAFTRNLPTAAYSFLLRANLLLLCPIIAAYIAFSKGIRSQRIQTALMVVGLLVALSIPLHRFMRPTIWRPWAVLFLGLGLWYLPVALAYLLAPLIGTQVKLVVYARWTLAGLFILNWLIFLG